MLNDLPGLVTFASEPAPGFVRMGPFTVIGGTGQEFFAIALPAAFTHSLPERLRLAFEFFSGSFFEPSPDGQLLMLTTAIETMLDLQPRPAEAQELVGHLLALTQQATSISEHERASLVGSLRWLMNESISQAGRKFARRLLHGRSYMDMTPDAFFRHCYDLRSALAHGRARESTRKEVRRVVGLLQFFVADLIYTDATGEQPPLRA